MIINSQMIIEEAKLFAEKLYDDESRDLYKARIQYSVDKDYYQLMENIWKVIKDKKWDIAPVTKRLISLCRYSDGVIIFGAGNNGKNIFWELKRFSEINVKFFLDNDIKMNGQNWCGVSIINPKEMKKPIHDYKIILSMEKESVRQEVKAQLEQLGVEAFNVIDPYWDGEKRIYSHIGNQYFDCPEFGFSEKEVFVDAGCCDGTTIELFMKSCNDNFLHVYGFEPDTTCAQSCKERFNGNGRISIIEKGAWREEGQVRFEERYEGMSCISYNGTKIIDVDSIDRNCINDKVTFIKMDIEGAELEALKGAECIIKRDKPKLAVCIYHKPEDVWEIPRLLMEYNPDYRFAIRHYHLTDYETVLYAW